MTSKRTIPALPSKWLGPTVVIVRYRCGLNGCGVVCAEIHRTRTGDLWWLTTGPAVVNHVSGRRASEGLAERNSELLIRLEPDGTVNRHASGRLIEHTPTTALEMSHPLARCPEHGTPVEVSSESVRADVEAGKLRRADRIVRHPPP